MTRRLPLVLAFALLCIWLLLNDTLAPAQLVMGTALALLLAFASARLRPLPARPRRLPTAIRLLVVVLYDIVRSNISVGRIILGLAPAGAARSGFLDIPMELRDPHGLAVLAMIVTSTPGTVWAQLSADGGTLRLHVLDLHDEAAWIRTIKQRYEQPLMEIFE